MFREIFLFELRGHFKKPSTYIYFSILFSLTLLIGLASAGVFNTTRTDSNIFVNSAYVVANILLGTSSSIFSILVSVLLISIMAGSVQKDYQYNTHPLFFTKPISKSGYFFGRFLATVVVAIFVFSGLLLGYLSGTLFGIGNPMIGEFILLNYLQPFLLFTVPNILLLGVLFFSLTTFTRTTTAAYIVAIVLMVFQIAASTITQNIDNKWLAALLEPTGYNALSFITEYWSPYEKNLRLIPLTGALLYNRLLWFGIAILICAFSFRQFRFSQFLQPLLWFKSKEKAETAVVKSVLHTLTDLPVVTQHYSSKALIKQCWWLGWFEVKKTVRSSFFLTMCVLGIGLMLLIVNFMDVMYEASTYMVTYKVIEDVTQSISFFAIIFIIFYSGTMIWRERDMRMDELVGVTPVSNASLFFSKLIGLSLAAILLSVIAAITGILIQLYNGFLQIDLLQYMVAILRNTATSIVLISFCLSVQVYLPNKYLGFFIALLPIVVLPIVYRIMEWDVELADFNKNGSGMPYSDMNGYGGTFTQWPFYRLYWTSIASGFIMLALMLYARGKEKSVKARWRLSAYLLNRSFLIIFILSLLTAAASGSFIYYQTKVLQVQRKPKEEERLMADMEKKYSRYRYMQQPRIIAVNAEVDIFPEQKRLRMAATYILKNKTTAPLDTLYISYLGGEKSPYHYARLEPKVSFTVIEDDKQYGTKLIKLNQPLLPGDSMTFVFDMEYRPRGLFDRMNAPVVDNGTFVNNGLMPSFGYNDNAELSENTARKEYGLAPKPRMAKVNDSIARMNNDISKDADWIRFEAIVSTAEGQTAIAPGYLQKEWKKEGRHFLHYRMDQPILNFYSVLSAAYQIKRDRWKDVNIEIYYHKGHEYNIDRMINSIKRSLDYYTTHFGFYQHRQVRVIEFPRYSSFAQSFPNTIPYAESIGFITKVEEGPDKIDVPFYVTAHEVAHQWWGHQVAGANVQGSALISETLSQYSALMVMKKTYGKEAMRKFLKEEMDKYLMGRTFEGKGEQPLMLVENQQYIHYNKGSVIMYALSDFIGEEKLNAAIRSYLEKNRYSGPIYTNSIELVDYIRRAVPDSLAYLTSDMFEKITLYENFVKSMSYKQLPNKTYSVSISVGSAKFYADSRGKQTSAKVNDYMDVGIFGSTTKDGKETEKQLLLHRIKMDQPEKTFRFVVKDKPESAGIDPYLKLIDRNPDNNRYKFGEKPVIPDLNTESRNANFIQVKSE